MQSQNSLERLVEADGGGAVEDDVDVLSQDTLIFLAQIQLRLCEVTVHGDDLLREARLLLLQSFKELRFNESQVESNTGSSQSLSTAECTVVHSNATVLHHTEVWQDLRDQTAPRRLPDHFSAPC